MKAKLIFLTLVIGLSFLKLIAQGQPNHGLILKGLLYENTVQYNEDHIIWKAKATMELVNTGNKPIIWINPQLHTDKFQVRSVYASQRNDFLFSKYTTRPEPDSDAMTKFAEAIDTDRPAENYFVILEPNDSLVFDDNIEVRQNFTKCVVEWPDKSKSIRVCWEGIIRETRNLPRLGEEINLMGKLSFKYEFSLVKWQTDPDLLEKLSQRWANYGVLPIDANGGLTIESEPIETRVYWK